MIHSANVKTNAKIAKTFYKTLDSGDILDFRMVNHYGPGVSFDIG